MHFYGITQGKPSNSLLQSNRKETSIMSLASWCENNGIKKGSKFYIDKMDFRLPFDLSENEMLQFFSGVITELDEVIIYLDKVHVESCGDMAIQRTSLFNGEIYRKYGLTVTIGDGIIIQTLKGDILSAGKDWKDAVNSLRIDSIKTSNALKVVCDTLSMELSADGCKQLLGYEKYVFGHILRKARYKVGLNLNDVAERLGVSRENLYLVEIGSSKPYEHNILIQLSKMLEMEDGVLNDASVATQTYLANKRKLDLALQYQVSQDMSLGLTVRLLRKRASLSIDKLASKIGISVGQLNKIELGDKDVGNNLMIDIADALGVDLDILKNR